MNEENNRTIPVPSDRRAAMLTMRHHEVEDYVALRDMDATDVGALSEDEDEDLLGNWDTAVAGQNRGAGSWRSAPTVAHHRDAAEFDAEVVSVVNQPWDACIDILGQRRCLDFGCQPIGNGEERDTRLVDIPGQQLVVKVEAAH